MSKRTNFHEFVLGTNTPPSFIGRSVCVLALFEFWSCVYIIDISYR